MRKRFITCIVFGALLTFGNKANAQNDFSDLLKNIVSGTTGKASDTTNTSKGSNNGLLSSLGSIFSNKLIATKDKIIGTWVYEEPAVVLSSKNALKNVGGKLATATIQSTLKTKLEKYGLKKGDVQMTFDKSGNFTQTIKGKTLKGTYTIEDKNITLKYNGKMSQAIGTTQLDGNSLLIVMDASKLLKYVKLLGNYAQSTTMKAATSLVGSMDGLECGLKLVRK